MHKKGFSLLELLITLVILAILGSLFYPSLITAKEEAKRSADASQIQQLLKAYTMYMGNHEGQVPFTTYVSNKGKTNNDVIAESGLPSTRHNYVTWVTFLYPYLKSKEVFWSPASNINQNTFMDSNRFKTGAFACFPSWGYNGCYFSIIKNDTPPTIVGSHPEPINESMIEEPSSTLVFANSTSNGEPYRDKIKGDVGYYLIVPPSSSEEWQAKNSASSPSPILSNHYGYLYPRFKNKTLCNVGFADGHVKGVSISVLKDEKIWQINKKRKWND